MGSSRLGKILTVMILVGSTGFMGFAVVSYLAGPNWERKANALTDYSFTPPTAPGGNWTVTARNLRHQQAKIAEPKTLPAAYIAALKHRLQDDQAQKAENEKRTAALKTKSTEAQELAKVDLPAIEKRIAYLNELVLRQNADSKLVSDQILAKTAEAQELNEQIAVRREETDRMRAQLEELRSRYTLLHEQKRRLNDLLIRSRGIYERARRRHELLQADVEQASGVN